MIDIIWYSLFKTVAVIWPPKLTAPENVTKSFTFAPCALTFTITFDSVPVVVFVVNVTPELIAGSFSGVMSLKVPPSSM